MGAIKIQTTQFLKFFSSAGYIWQYFFEGRITVSVNTFTYLSIFSLSFVLSVFMQSIESEAKGGPAARR
jgi:hypothetical protein